MSEEEIRTYLSRQSQASEIKLPVPPVRPAGRQRAQPPQEESAFQDFSATHLLCPRCKQAMPVKQKILLFLPDGDLYDYTCEACGTSVGTRKAGR